MFARVSKSLSWVLVLGAAALMPVALSAQVTPAAKGTPAEPQAPKWDIFIGYSFFAPYDTVHALQPYGQILPFNFEVEKKGLTESLSYFYSRHWGIQVESGEHDLFTNTGASNQGSSNSGIWTLEPGLVYRRPHKYITPVVHALAGAVYVDGPDHEPYTWGWGMTAGGALDYNGLCSNRHSTNLAVRLFQVDYEYLHADSGISHYNQNIFIWGDDEKINGLKLSAGVVLGAGGCAPPPPIALTCYATPDTVFPGDPVTVNATPAYLDPKLNTVYTWSGPGVTGHGETASVSTASLKAGTYMIQAEVKEGKPGKEGLRSGQTADCTTSFKVKAFEPPTLTCLAIPSTINPGDKSTVTATGVSPQNRPLTYSYSVTPGAGAVNGSGTTATYDSTGAPTGDVPINCTVTDDLGQTASAGTSVTITKPYVKPIPHASALCPITFTKDKQRPARVDNEAKACLDQVTDALKNDPTATVVVVGEANGKEKTPPKNKRAKLEDLAAERAVNTKDYLVNEEQSGIDSSRIIVRTGTSDSQSVENYLVPAGATFDNDVKGTLPVAESGVKKLTRKPIPVPGTKPEHKKKHAAAKAAA
jgi:outer membrane protein OmpA-like peptidoglycan-associated protein